MQLNDLRRLEKASGLASELHGQHGGNGKVRGDQHAHPRVCRTPVLHLFEALRRKTRGPHHARNTVGNAKLQVVHDHAGLREIHHHFRALVHEGLQRIVAIYLRHQLQIRRRRDPLAHRLAHAPARAEDTDLDLRISHSCSPLYFASRSRKPPRF